MNADLYPKPNENNQGTYFHNYQNPPEQQYKPPSSFDSRIPYNFSPAYTNTKLSAKMMDIDSRLSKFNDFCTIVWCLLIFSLFSFLSSIGEFTLEDNEELFIEKSKHRKIFDFINFSVNLTHAAGYFYIIQSYTKQHSKMMSISSLILLVLAGSNLGYFLIYIFLQPVSFLFWCVDITFLVLNFILYSQSQEICKLYQAKEEMRTVYNL